MAIDRFDPPSPSFPASVDYEASYDEVRFGGGYSKRVAKLGGPTEKLSLTWTGLTTNEKNEIKDFLLKKSGGVPFDWFIEEIGDFRLIWNSMNISFVHGDTYDISVEFEKVRDLGQSEPKAMNNG